MTLVLLKKVLTGRDTVQLLQRDPDQIRCVLACSQCAVVSSTRRTHLDYLQWMVVMYPNHNIWLLWLWCSCRLSPVSLWRKLTSAGCLKHLIVSVAFQRSWPPHRLHRAELWVWRLLNQMFPSPRLCTKISYMITNIKVVHSALVQVGWLVLMLTS